MGEEDFAIDWGLDLLDDAAIEGVENLGNDFALADDFACFLLLDEDTGYLALDGDEVLLVDEGGGESVLERLHGDDACAVHEAEDALDAELCLVLVGAVGLTGIDGVGVGAPELPVEVEQGGVERKGLSD